MLGRYRYNNSFNTDPQPQVTWLDDLVLSNPHGIMQVLAKNGYTGYLAPQNKEELVEASYLFIQTKGDQAVVELLKAHPLYDVIAGIAKEDTEVKVNFKNASGDITSVITTIKTINYKKLIENLLIIIGAVYVADKLWKSFSQ